MDWTARPAVQELIDNFDFLDDWEQRFTYLIDLGRKLEPLPESQQTDATRVHGCQATVHMVFSVEKTGGGHGGHGGQVVRLAASSDAHIVNGLIAILIMLYDQAPLAEASGYDAAGLFEQLGLQTHLSPTRRNGLHAMLKRIETAMQTAMNGD